MCIRDSLRGVRRLGHARAQPVARHLGAQARELRRGGTRGQDTESGRRGGAVSYTHLDVYKRQDLASLYRGADEERKRKLISEVDRESSEFLTALDSGVSHESGWFIWDIKRDEPVLENACLLYTSRCV